MELMEHFQFIMLLESQINVHGVYQYLHLNTQQEFILRTEGNMVSVMVKVAILELMLKNRYQCNADYVNLKQRTWSSCFNILLNMRLKNQRGQLNFSVQLGTLAFFIFVENLIMDKWAISPTGASGSESKSKRTKPGDMQAFMLKIVALLAKMNLKHSLDIRELQSAVFLTATLDKTAKIIVEATNAVKEWNTQAEKNRAAGQPGLHVCGRLEGQVAEPQRQ